MERKTLAKTAAACVAALASLSALQIGEYSLPAAETETEAAKTESAAAETETGGTKDAADGVKDAEAESAEAADDTEASSEAAAKSSAADTSGTAAYTPGTYTASAKGIESDVTAVCTFDETGLTDIDLDVSGETAGLGADIGDEMSAAILEAQSADVDGVSGATVTSTAVLAAVSECFSQAAGAPAERSAESETETASEAATEPETETKAETETALESETETASVSETGAASEAETETEIAEAAAKTNAVAKTETENASEAETEAASESETETAEAASEAETESTEAASEAESEAEEAAGAYTAGTYTAFAKGLESDVTVFCTFDESGLTAISLDVSGETPDIGGAIGDEMSAAILEAQSAEVDSVSGATITSTAIINAVQSCFDQAAGTEAAGDAAEDEKQAEAASTGKYTPGTYTASATGMESIVNAFCTFDENSLVAIGLDISGAESDFIDPVRDEMTSAILEAQSTEVDTVSGATATSDAVLEAVQSCFDQAAGTGNAS